MLTARDTVIFVEPRLPRYTCAYDPVFSRGSCPHRIAYNSDSSLSIDKTIERDG